MQLMFKILYKRKSENCWKHLIMRVIQISRNLSQMKIFVRWNNSTKFFCPNIYSSEDILYQKINKMQTWNLQTRM